MRIWAKKYSLGFHAHEACVGEPEPARNLYRSNIIWQIFTEEQHP